MFLVLAVEYAKKSCQNNSCSNFVAWIKEKTNFLNDFLCLKFFFWLNKMTYENYKTVNKNRCTAKHEHWSKTFSEISSWLPLIKIFASNFRSGRATASQLRHKTMVIYFGPYQRMHTSHWEPCRKVIYNTIWLIFVKRLILRCGYKLQVW